MTASKDAKSRLSGDKQPNLAPLARRVANTAVQSDSRHTVAGGDTPTPQTAYDRSRRRPEDHEDTITTLQVVGQLQAEQERS